MVKTNREHLLEIGVIGEVTHASVEVPYTTGWDGKPSVSMGRGGIVYNVKPGDPCFGWASGDHVEPGVTIRGTEKPSPSDCALAILACIGNEAVVVSGEGKGATGVFTGRHAGSDDMVYFIREDLEKLAIGDKVQVKAVGAGMELLDYPDTGVSVSGGEGWQACCACGEGGARSPHGLRHRLRLQHRARGL